VDERAEGVAVRTTLAVASASPARPPRPDARPARDCSPALVPAAMAEVTEGGGWVVVTEGEQGQGLVGPEGHRAHAETVTHGER
jgi:hypothetical protein